MWTSMVSSDMNTNSRLKDGHVLMLLMKNITTILVLKWLKKLYHLNHLLSFEEICEPDIQEKVLI